MLTAVKEKYRCRLGFTLDEEDELHLLFSSRENGDISEGIPGKNDLINGRRMCTEIERDYPQLKTLLDVVDEWVIVEVSIKQ